MRCPLLLVVCAMTSLAWADGPGDNVPDNVRPIPPKGSVIPAETEKELRAGLKDMLDIIKKIGPKAAEMQGGLGLFADVVVYEKAVRYALDHNELYVNEKTKRDDVAVAKAILKKGLERAKELEEAKPSWTKAKGLVVRGYVSQIDGSVQPYGLVIPDDYDGTKPMRLDVWWHGRYEDTLELGFISERQRSRGEFSQSGVIMVHPFGRFSNANKFAGEIDTFEVINDVKQKYNIDATRIVARGFSMGGAACWQFATHYPSFFCAAAPGAGFAETKEFLGNFQNEKVKPEWWEQKLWRMYDATEYAGNLALIPTIAYSGENDRQKQAADIMTKYAKAAGVEFPHVIGKGAGHNYTNDAKKEINKFIDEAAANGSDLFPKSFAFTTHTLRYDRAAGIRIVGMGKHWEPATFKGTRRDGKVTLTTENITAIAVGFPKSPQQDGQKCTVIIDGTEITGTLKHDQIGTGTNRHMLMLAKINGKWKAHDYGDFNDTRNLRKRHGMQGPIDDAFMSSFIFVKPTGKPLNEATGKWVDAEMKRAISEWRRHFRGDIQVITDKDALKDVYQTSQLVLWGDPQSNAVLAKIKDKLPLMDSFGDTTIPALIYPNPLNPNKYVVLNSGFTYREYDYLNNARQVSKLPDYAVIDVTTPANSRLPGKIVRAGFFDELWKLQKNDGKE